MRERCQGTSWVAAAITLWACFMLSLPVQAGDSDATAATNSALSKRWTFTAGALLNIADAEVASTIKSLGVGGRVDLSDIGADDHHTSPFFAIKWRPSQRWRWDFSYQNLKLDGFRGATYEIEFDDITIPVGWDVRSNLSAHLYSATVGYAFYRTPDAELGGLFGLHVFDASAAIRGTGFVGSVQETRAAGISEVLPIPTLGLYGTYAISRRLAVEGKVQYLQASYGNYSGDILIANAALSFAMMESSSLVIGYKYIDIDVSHDGRSTKETYSVDFGGPYAAISIGF